LLDPQPCVRLGRAHKLKSPQVQPKHRHSLHAGLRLSSYSPRRPDFVVSVACTSRRVGPDRADGRQSAKLMPALAQLAPAFQSSCAQHPLSRTSESKGASKINISSAAFDLKFQLRPCGNSAGTSNRRHWYHTTSSSAHDVTRQLTCRVHRIPPHVS